MDAHLVLQAVPLRLDPLVTVPVLEGVPLYVQSTPSPTPQVHAQLALSILNLLSDPLHYLLACVWLTSMVAPPHALLVLTAVS